MGFKLKLRSLIFDFVSKYKERMPYWLYWFLSARLPFGLSFFDMSPLTDEDIAIIDELVKKYGQYPDTTGGIELPPTPPPR